METDPQEAEEDKEILLRLSSADFRILEKFRGSLGPDAFFSALLRMIDSGAVFEKPTWVKDKEAK